LFEPKDFVYEHHVGNGLRLDIFMPKYDIGIEYHGRQHFEFSTHFHGDRAGYLKAIQRDFAKVEACQAQGITLVVFTDREIMTKDLVYEKMMDAFMNPVPQVKKPLTHEEQMKERAREYRRERYRESKERRNR
jgi:hypothetical protein